MDFLHHWSLSSNPFGRNPSESFFAANPQREVIARLNYLIAGGLSCGLLLAEKGSGLSTLMQHVALSNGFGDTAVQMLLTKTPAGTKDSVFEEIASQLYLSSAPGNLESRVRDALSGLARQSVRTVWLVDRCNPSLAEVARSLIDRNAFLSVVLGIGPEQTKEICGALGHCPLRMELTPISLEDSMRYVIWALENAAGSGSTANRIKSIFSDSAIVRLHELGEGKMGLMRGIAELALMVGASHQLRQIDADLLESIQSELVRAA